MTTNVRFAAVPRKLISSGSPFEVRIGYSRAVVDVVHQHGPGVCCAVERLGREHANRDVLEKLPQLSNVPRYVAMHGSIA